MKKKASLYVLYGLTGLIICLTLFALVKFSIPYYSNGYFFDQSEQQASAPVLAVYHPTRLSSDHTVDLEHLTIKWSNAEKWAFRDKLIPDLPEDRALLITIEMWEKGFPGSSQGSMLKATLNGDYDQKIRKLCRAIANKPQQVYIRWNPEMEVPAGRYPWQNQSPRQYIQAFRHFARLCKAHAPDARIVWGPAGYPGTLEYWPGADAVDFVSISLQSQSELQTSAYPQNDSIPDLIKRKLHRLRFLNKPVMLIGSENIRKENYRQEWLEVAKAEILEARKEIGRSYSRAVDPGLSFQNTNREANVPLRVGVYDPQQFLTGEEPVTVEHIFINWNEVKEGVFERKFKQIIDRGHHAIITMEPHPEKEDHTPHLNVLEQTLSGQHDAEIQKLFNIISDVGQTVYLRWAHEMEIPVDRYAWQNQDPILYIKAYRYFATYKNPLPANIRLVWGPAGDRGSLEWWPGDDVVDYISIAVYGLPDKNIRNHEDQESFSTIVNRKLHRMRFTDKPVFITEFGVKGPDEFQRQWLEEAAITINQSPEITGVCYFNLYDHPGVWGEGEAPDWGISQDTFIYFAQVLEE